MIVKTTFYDLISKYSNEENIKNAYWNEIEKYYSNHKRYYHTLKHIEEIILQISDIKERIIDLDTLLLAFFS